jgi:branched-chain amino acid transport system permease protein
MDQSLVFWWVMAWMLVWGTAGSIVTPRVYVRRNLEVSRSRLAGATIGAATGPFGLAALWSLTPKLSSRWLVLSSFLALGVIYGFMALGLTLIFSILGVVSFAHGEFYMIGGMLVYYITAVWFPGLNPLLGVLGACAIAFAIGAVFERTMLTPMYHGKVDRPVEYGILVTFGLAFTLQYLVQALHGASPVKVQRYIDFPRFEWPEGPRRSGSRPAAAT